MIVEMPLPTPSSRMTLRSHTRRAAAAPAAESAATTAGAPVPGNNALNPIQLTAANLPSQQVSLNELGMTAANLGSKQPVPGNNALNPIQLTAANLGLKQPVPGNNALNPIQLTAANLGSKPPSASALNIARRGAAQRGKTGQSTPVSHHQARPNPLQPLSPAPGSYPDEATLKKRFNMNPVPIMLNIKNGQFKVSIPRARGIKGSLEICSPSLKGIREIITADVEGGAILKPSALGRVTGKRGGATRRLNTRRHTTRKH